MNRINLRLLLWAVAMSVPLSAQAASLGLNWVGSGSPLTDAGGAFGVPLSAWNNLSGASGSSTISPATGGGLTVTWTTGGSVWQSGASFPGFSAGENQVFSGNLWAKQNDPGAAGPISVTLSGMGSIATGTYELQLMAAIDGGAIFRPAAVSTGDMLYFGTPVHNGGPMAAVTTNLPLSGDTFSFTIANDNVFEGGVKVRAELCGLVLTYTPAPAPEITQQPQSQTVPEGVDAAFNVVATGAEPLSYQWQFNGVDMPGENADTLTVLNAAAGNVGSYRVKVSDSAGRYSLSQEATLIVALPAPGLGYDPASITSAGAEGFGGGLANSFDVVAGTSVEISGIGTVLYEASVTDTLTVQMFALPGGSVLATVTIGVGDVSTPVASTPALNLFLKPLPSPLTLGPGEYAIAVYGNTATARVPRTPVGVTVHPSGAIRHRGSSYGGWEGPGNFPGVPDGTGFQYLAGTFMLSVSGKPAITAQPQGGSFPPGASPTPTLTVAAGGSLPLTYQWQKDGINIDGATRASLTLANLGSLDSGDYRVIVSNNIGSVTSAVARIEVAGTPTVELQLNPGIVIHGTAGLHYRVEWRDALAPGSPWQLLQDIPSLPSAVHVIYDPTPVSATNKRFYQAVLVP